MKDFFSFPEKYRVSKQISVKQLIQSANLTKVEANKLHMTLQEVSILYSIKCKDNKELIIIAASVANLLYSDIHDDDVAKAIAASIPQDVIVVLFIGKHARMYAFNTEVNKHNNYRRVVKKQASTGYFDAEMPEAAIQKMINTIRHTELPPESSREAIDRWMGEISWNRHEQKENCTVTNRRYFSLDKNERQERRSKRITSFFCRCAIILIREYEQEDERAEPEIYDWIESYLDVCREIVNDYGTVSMTVPDEQRIINAIGKRNSDDYLLESNDENISYDGTLDLNTIRVYMGYHGYE